MEPNIISLTSLKEAIFYPYIIIRITDENMPNLKIEQENDTGLFALWHTNCFLFVGVSAAVADSLQRHATRLL